MNHCDIPHVPDGKWSFESCSEMADRLTALRLLVCDLLKTNQELRYALLEAGACGQHNQGAQPKQSDENL